MPIPKYDRPQRPGRETSKITDKPTDTPQIQVPEFKISTEVDPEYSILRGQQIRKYKDAYDAAYNEYLERHPLPKTSGVGYNLYIGTQYHPEVQRQQAAHLYAQDKSGYIAPDPTAPWKQSDEKFAKFSGDVLGAALFAPEFVTYGALGGAARIGGGMLGGAVGGYVGSEVGKSLDKTFGTRWLEPTLGIAGGFAGWGKGANLGYRAGLKGVQYGASKGFVPHNWLASPEMKLDALKDAGINVTPEFRFQNPLKAITSGRTYQAPQTTIKSVFPQIAYTSNVPDYSKLDEAYKIAVESGNTAESNRLEELMWKLKAPNSKVSTPQYHSTNNYPFKGYRFDINHPSFYGPPDAYIHVGTEQAAKDIGGSTTLKLFVNQVNPLKTYDGIQDSQMNIIREIAKNKSLSDEEVQKLYKEWKDNLTGVHYDDLTLARNNKVRELLNRYGFDGIEYINNAEDAGSISRGLIDPKQLKLAGPTYNDNGQLIPLSQRFDFSNPDIRYSKGNPTGSEIFAERYDGNPLRWDNINKDIITGRTEAINYLNSKRKQLTDQHNVDIAKRLFNVDITPEPNPGLRASTDMQFTSTPILKGTWYPKFGVRLTFDPNSTTKGNTVFNYKDPSKDEVSLDLSSDLEDAALHEWLHRGNIGEGRGDITRAFYKWKSQKLLKPEFWNDEYFGNPQEVATNLIEIGRRNGITNAEYPGFNKAIEQLRYIINNDPNKGYLLNKTRWETKPKRVWDALQGKYMGLIPVGFGTGLMLNNNGNE